MCEGGPSLYLQCVVAAGVVDGVVRDTTHTHLTHTHTLDTHRENTYLQCVVAAGVVDGVVHHAGQPGLEELQGDVALFFLDMCVCVSVCVCHRVS